ncbi:MAG: glycoside hydrolase family 65, partial [Lachnospiraceae bacterium]|nr:glycoside hydrolase family 65 [Lachnospiraceae bacterium]
KENCPLTTMADWAWHTAPSDEGKIYKASELKFTEYDYLGRKVTYPVKEIPGNEKEYEWFRKNPHRANLSRIRLFLDKRPIEVKEINSISQTLDMYTGVLKSSFNIGSEKVLVTTAVGKADTLAIKVESKLCKERLSILVDFPYGSSDITASDFDKKEKHSTVLRTLDGKNLVERKMDDFSYYVLLTTNMTCKPVKTHEISLSSNGATSFTVVFSFADNKDSFKETSFKDILEESKVRFYTYWNMGAMIDVTESEDKRADILQKRIITSMYQCFVQDLGNMPSQETGLTCNSWYGKFHLEMHPIHSAFAALYGRGALLEKSLKWYMDILPKAKENAKRNGFKGARWPKMVGPDGVDSPSVIAPLLIWQQPHIIYMLELLRRSRYSENRVEVPKETEKEFLERYKELIKETAIFMEDFVVYNKETDEYELLAPLYSVQEKGNPEEIKNPPFELAYWSFGLKTAYKWLKALGEENEMWLILSNKMAKPFVRDGKLSAYAGYKDTYTKLNLDHPSMLFAYGWLSEKIDEKVLINSYNEFEKVWDFKSLWGWDFALLSMVLAKSGQPEKAFDVLLMDSEKNSYLDNGFNAQISRNDLPLYMPGNGSLLLAMTLLKSCKNWYVKTEGLMDYPF